MIYKATIILLFFLMCSFQSDSFKDLQKKYARVRKAYNDKEANMIALLKNKKIDQSKMEIYIRAFKSEKELELWGKNTSDQEFLHIKTYTVCATSGLIGPKRMQGDLQIPEGFYYIDRFNPYSNFYLSLGINYPNTSDRILGDKNNLGGDIFIHGDCVTIGCLPITDSEIKELYIFCVEAKNNGQLKIPLTIYPTKLSDAEFEKLIIKYKTDADKIGLWSDLKQSYDLFNSSKKKPEVVFLNTGRHKLN
jgi:murein L,D-transpeptidase YafK